MMLNFSEHKRAVFCIMPILHVLHDLIVYLDALECTHSQESLDSAFGCDSSEDSLDKYSLNSMK